MKLLPLEHKHFPDLFKVMSVTEAWLDLDRNTSDRLFSQREGFVVVNNKNEIVGHITFSDYIVKLEVTIHCSILPEYHKRWLTRSIYKECFDYVFNELECVRASGFAIEGINDLTFHQRLGFSWEGCYRMGFRHWDKYYNLHRYGMLSHERKW